MPKEIYLNNAVDYLNADITNSATSFAVQGSAAFPASGGYMVRIDDELVSVQSASGATLTVLRAQEGTTGAAHTAGTPVYGVVTAGSLRRLVRQSHGGTLAGARREINFVDGGGVTWTLTDDATNDKVDVSASTSGGSGSGGTAQSYEAAWTVPVLTDYTWNNQGSATANDDGKGIFLTTPAASQNNLKLLGRATPSAPWTYTAKVIPANFGVNIPACGIFWSIGSSGHMHTIRFNQGNTIDLTEFNSPTSYAGTDVGAINCTQHTPFHWVKVANNGTNIAVSVSIDGSHWLDIKTDLTASYIGSPFNFVGPFVEGATSVWPSSCKLVSAAFS